MLIISRTALRYYIVSALRFIQAILPGKFSILLTTLVVQTLGIRFDTTKKELMANSFRSTHPRIIINQQAKLGRLEYFIGLIPYALVFD